MSLNALSLSVKLFTGFERRYQQPDKGHLWGVDTCIEITPYRWPLLTSCKNVKFQEMPAFGTSHVKVSRKKESNKCGVCTGQRQHYEAKKMKDRQRRNPNKQGGEEDWRSNPSEVQTALRRAMALRRRDQARRTSSGRTGAGIQPSKRCPTLAAL